MSAPTVQRGSAGRWTQGDGHVQLGATGLASTVRLRIRSADGGMPDRLALVLDGTPVATTPLDREWTDLEFVADRHSRGRLSLQSATTAAPDGQRQGVFLDWIDVTTGGARGASIATAASLALAILALLVTATLAQPLAASAVVGAPVREWWLTIATAGAALIVTILFRDAVLRHVGAVAAGTSGLSACAWTVIVLNEDATRRRWLASALFCAASTLLVAGLFSEAWLEGRVLSQADMLYDHTPWLEHRPPGWRALPRPPFGDVPMFVYPFQAIAIERLRAFDLPLWTPGVGAGVPVLAN
ncbi:MAG: hypothetical protein ABIT71_02495, partial [Vicinamibacteraceae bacterium]